MVPTHRLVSAGGRGERAVQQSGGQQRGGGQRRTGHAGRRRGLGHGAEVGRGGSPLSLLSPPVAACPPPRASSRSCLLFSPSRGCTGRGDTARRHRGTGGTPFPLLPCTGPWALCSRVSPPGAGSGGPWAVQCSPRCVCGGGGGGEYSSSPPRFYIGRRGSTGWSHLRAVSMLPVPQPQSSLDPQCLPRPLSPS